MNTFHERLRKSRESRGLSQTALAEIGGVKKLAQINYEKGERQPDAGYLLRLADAGFDVLEILTGESRPSDLIQGSYLATDDAKRLLSVTKPLAHYGITRLPVYDLRASAGGGALTDDAPEHLGDYEISSELLRKVWNLTPSSTSIYIVQGPSMEPDIRSGEALFVDTSVQRIAADGLYVFEIGEERYIKDLQRLPKSRIKVISRNPMFEPWFIELDQLAELKIIGQVKVHGRLV